ncbi:hypothetical protein NitYY0826_C1652 [Nitratiruptor sp. YY08-26]|uniref:hypothetical protein n=1 Tax=unclassified Nitratiruptor TaxID=2624044 RepID=UPI001915B96E|nr:MULTISPECIES: hypothetical protein [unclassified Nitratiruptor]BCD62769.1 hypothetical protein NitYY0813_C1650 [Nitratiruptor sp. YY08-13]BCD66705.1 hypothetical protein NitYY0826_C1652 [Nitratiruptor sp. YY08-26]
MKRTLLFFTVVLLFAGEYITLDNGKVIELKPDGTWHEVKVIKKGSDTIALKPDGTWEKVEAKKIEAANKLETAVDKKYKDEPLVKTLLGKWEGDGIFMEFEPSSAKIKIKKGHTNRVIEGKWIVEKVDEKSKTVTVNIGEGARLGFLTFGGEIRKIKIKDNNTIVDKTDAIEGKVYTLYRRR